MYLILRILFFALNVNCFMWFKHSAYMIDSIKCSEDSKPIVEYYNLDQTQYMLLSEKVSWDEAQIICSNYQAQLAIVDTHKKALKLGKAISESNIEIDDIWIGGQRYEDGVWMWKNDEIISTKTENEFPPWVRRPNRPWKECLGMGRLTHFLPMFIDLDCRLSKSFMCQRDLNGPLNPDVTLPSQWVSAGKSTYLLYHARLAWKEAASFCRLHGYRLAIIPNNNSSRIISKAMFRSRPSFESVWIGGHFAHKRWRWLSTGRSFYNHPNKDNYPPWHYNSTNITDGCVLLDRHLCEEPVFVAVGCDRQRGFMCEKYPKDVKPPIPKKNSVNITYQNTTMLLFLKELPWDAAMNYCYSHKSYLSEITDDGMLTAITKALSDQPTEPVHVWLGGRLINQMWTWVNSNKPIPTAPFLRWCDYDQDPKNACLNMDREAHEKSGIYGLKCKIKQPFVCTVGKITITTTTSTTPTTTSTTPTTTTTMTTTTTTTPAPPEDCEQQEPIVKNIGSKIYTTFFTKTNYEVARNNCESAGGTLVKQEFAAKVVPDLKKDITCDGEAWIDYNKCSYIDLKTGVISDDAKSVDCSKQRGFMCEVECEQPTTRKFKNNIWECNNEMDVKVCNVQCKSGLVHIGGDFVKCTNKKGWTNSQQITTYLPFCEEVPRVLRKLLILINNYLKSKHGFLFLVDESDINFDLWWLQMQFVANIVQIYPASDDFPVGLITFGEKPIVHIPYNYTDSCKVLEKIKDIKPHRKNRFAPYREALYAAKYQIDQLQQSKETIIFFITAGQDNGEALGEVLHDIRRDGHVIIGVGVTAEELYDLNYIASMKNSSLSIFKFTTANSFNNFLIKMDRFTSHASKSLKCKTKLPWTTLNPTEKNIIRRSCTEGALSVVVHDKIYAVFFTYVTYNEAASRCERAGGVIPSAPKRHKQQLGQQIMSTLTCQNLRIWIGPKTEKCNFISFTPKKLRDSVNRVNSCSAKLGHLCKIDCSSKPLTTGIFNETHWVCGKVGKRPTCSAKCRDHLVLFGAEYIKCAEGWKVVKTDSLTYFPYCLDERRAVEKLVTTLEELKKDERGLLFIVNEPRTNGSGTKWFSRLQFVASIVQVFPASSKVPVGLLTFRKEVHVRIPYNATDSCEILKTLSQMKSTPEENKHADYGKVLAEVKRQIRTLQPNLTTITFFITDTPNDGSDFRDLIRELTVDSKFLTMGIKSKLYDLDAVASMYHEDLLSFKFHSYKSFRHLLTLILNKRNTELTCPQFIFPEVSLADNPDAQRARSGVAETTAVPYIYYNTSETFKQAQKRCQVSGATILQEGMVNTTAIEYEPSQYLQWIDQGQENVNPLLCKAINLDTKLKIMVDCVDKLPYLCQSVCSIAMPNDEGNNWVCTEEANEHKTCQLNCSNGFALVGASTMSCAFNKWSSFDKLVQFGICLSSANIAAYLKTELQWTERHGYDGVFFIIDNVHNNETNFKILKNFVANLMRLIRRHSQMSLGFATFNNNYHTHLSFSKSHICKAIWKMMQMRRNADSEVLYDAGLEAAAKQVGHHNRSLIILITDEKSKFSLIYESIVDEIQENNKIMVITAGDFNKTELMNIATEGFQYELNMFQFTDYAQLQEVSQMIYKGGEDFQCY